jgi:tripartite-type tricarboxylate transporter receptor subunit TctC
LTPTPPLLALARFDVLVIEKAGIFRFEFLVAPPAAGRLRALAVTTAMRLEMLPETPAMGEFVPGFEASAWLGFGTPKDTPTAVVDLLNREINLAIAAPAIKGRLVELGGLVLPPLSPADFGKLIADDTEKWAKVIRRANIKPE